MYINQSKSNFIKIIAWNRDRKKKERTRFSMLLSDAIKTKQARVKQASKVYHSRVLRHVKATFRGGRRGGSLGAKVPPQSAEGGLSPPSN